MPLGKRIYIAKNLEGFSETWKALHFLRVKNVDNSPPRYPKHTETKTYVLTCRDRIAKKTRDTVIKVLVEKLDSTCIGLYICHILKTRLLEWPNDLKHQFR